MELSEYFKRYGIKKVWFAGLLGISLTSLGRIMKGTHYPSAKTAQKIVELTNGKVTFNDLFRY
ncbi:MAG: helix-turn-helix transcriptional regulator [Simkaniaceae bacterium]|nr:MAG: helix-turn-helix transcriptional regulator [Simkaniaceae bacterium]